MIIKDTDEQADEAVRSERVPSTGISVPVELGYITLWHRDVFINPEVL